MDKPDPIDRASLSPDPFRFWFVKPNGSAFSRRVFWTSLYAFTFGKKKILAAFSVVPHSDTLFAMATALKSNLFPTSGQIFHRETEPVSAESPAESRTALMRVMADLSPLKTTDLAHIIGPEDMAALSAIMNPRALPVDSPAAALSPVMAPPPQPNAADKGPDMGGLVLMSGLRGDDIARIQAGLWAHRLIEDRLAMAADRAVEESHAGNALALRSTVEEEMKKSLYADPRYLGFVQWVLEAKGSLASPLIIDFLKFCHRMIGVTARKRAAAEGFDASFWQDELNARLGHIEAAVMKTLPFHNVTVLGTVAQGDLPVMRDDPQASEAVYRVDSDADIGSVALETIRQRLRKAYLAEKIRFAFRGNIEKIEFVA
ncbi:MAG: hypothetical protein IT210_25940 [Armatimonadetes bacterium]|nr:hypothetical protein [Armatimonadota bacterium]